MKQLIILLALFNVCFGQNRDTTKYTPNRDFGVNFRAIKVDSALMLPRDTIRNKRGIAQFGKRVFTGDGINWSELTGTGGSADTTNNTYLTRTQADVRYVRLQTLPPTSSISGGFSQERVATGSSLSYNVNWSAGRQSGNLSSAETNPLASIIVNGISQSFTQPSAGSSVSGTVTVSVARNTSTTINNSVTTTDGKNATSSTTFSFFDRRYIGWADNPTPTDAEILAAVYKDNSGGNSSISITLSQIGTAKYLFIANTSSISSITLNGFSSTAAFNRNISRSFTNASGGTTTYLVSTSINAIGATSSTVLVTN